MSVTADDTNGNNVTLVPVPEVLTTLSHEVRVLSDSINDLQDLIGNLVVAGALAARSRFTNCSVSIGFPKASMPFPVT
jgi:hypothetical protein